MELSQGSHATCARASTRSRSRACEPGGRGRDVRARLPDGTRGGRAERVAAVEAADHVRARARTPAVARRALVDVETPRIPRSSEPRGARRAHGVDRAPVPRRTVARRHRRHRIAEAGVRRRATPRGRRRVGAPRLRVVRVLSAVAQRRETTPHKRPARVPGRAAPTVPAGLCARVHDGRRLAPRAEERTGARARGRAVDDRTRAPVETAVRLARRVARPWMTRTPLMGGVAHAQVRVRGPGNRRAVFTTRHAVHARPEARGRRRQGGDQRVAHPAGAAGR